MIGAAIIQALNWYFCAGIVAVIALIMYVSPKS